MRYIIIGTSQGIGKEIAGLLIKKHELILCSRNITKVKKIFLDKKTLFLKFNAKKIKDINKLAKFTQSKFGKVDGIICCHGYLGAPESIGDYNLNKWFDIFDLNFKSNLIITRKILKLVKKNQFSKIIFFAGGGAFNALEKFSPYSVAKTALVRFSENLAAELKEYKIMVNCISPGFLKTNIHNKNLKRLNKLPQEYRIQLKKKMKTKPDYRNVLGLVNFMLKRKDMHFSGRTVSANFDKWNNKKFLTYLRKDKDYLTLRRMNIYN